MAKPLRFLQLAGNCHVCVSHQKKDTGYVRYKDPRTGERTGLHRLIYELHNGPIPEGYHINHTCGVRSCCNPNHLEALPAVEHHKKDGRKLLRKQRNLFFMFLRTGINVSTHHMARILGVGQPSVSRWGRKGESEFDLTPEQNWTQIVGTIQPKNPETITTYCK